jgi:hypothetical protein
MLAAAVPRAPALPDAAATLAQFASSTAWSVTEAVPVVADTDAVPVVADTDAVERAQGDLDDAPTTMDWTVFVTQLAVVGGGGLLAVFASCSTQTDCHDMLFFSYDQCMFA